MAEPKKTQVIAAADSAETKAADIDSKEPVKKTAPKKAAARKTVKKEAVKNDEAKAEKAPAKTAKKAGKKAAPKTAAKAGTKKAAAVSAAKSAAQPAAEEGKAAPAKRGRKAKAELTPVEEKAEESSLKELAEKEKTVLAPEKKEAEKPAPVKEEVKPEEKPAEPAKPAEEVKPAPVKEAPVKEAEPVKEEAKPAQEEAEKIEAEANKESEKELAEKQKPAFEAKKPAKAKKAAVKKAAKAAAPAEAEKPAEEAKAAPAKEEPIAEEIKVEEKAPVEEVKVEAVPVEEVKVEAAPAEEVKVEAAPVEETVTVEEIVIPETDIAEKLGHYNSFSLDTLFAMAAAMGIQTTYDDIVKALLLTDDEADIALNLINEAGVKASDYSFEEDGYDISLIPVLIQRVADTMDFKASDYRNIAKGIQQALDFEYSNDPMENADEYHRMFDLVRKILMLAQQKNIHNVADLEKVIPADIRGLIVKFMDHAYPLLKNWTYNDVRYYEGFINGILSQFDDLRTDLSNRALMDVADLMIVHGDYGLGDANYNYVIRENKLKDYIFYRFANIYKDIDLNKAKAIANDALRYVDGRYTYYPEIIRILEMW